MLARCNALMQIILCEGFLYLCKFFYVGAVMTNIQRLRSQIDQLDHQLLVLLAQRQQIVEQIGRLKPAGSHAAVTAPERVKQVLLSRQQQAKELGLSPDVALAVWQAMIESFTALELSINSKNSYHKGNRK